MAGLILLLVGLGAAVPAVAGDLRLSCPAGAEIFVDGALVGTCGAAEGGTVLTGLSDGQHILRVEQARFLPMEFPVVTGPTPRQVEVGQLSPRAPSDAGETGSPDPSNMPLGSIEISSVPTDCSLRIGDRWARKHEPLMILLGVPFGEHALWFERFGQLLKTTVEITAETPVQVLHVDFENERVETRAAASAADEPASQEPQEPPDGEPGCVEYWVQVLRTGDLEKIELTQEQLDQLGFPPRDQKLITVEDDGVLPLYKLRIGPLRDRWTAKLVIHKIQPLQILSPLVLTEPCRQQR
ncbi:MAG TPA: SPOR domain-containing protein [Chondromyces sp.]|nr:SPOR domain-containing protein [Chondromyces sp.]